MIDLLQPYENQLNKTLYLNFKDWTIKDSAFEYFNLESILVNEGD